MKKTKIMDINLGFNEGSKNFYIEIETYITENNKNISLGKVIENIDVACISKLIKTIQTEVVKQDGGMNNE
jgi:hypothetical protein